MTETEVSAALAAARALVSPPDHASLVAADAHLRATQASASGWVVARAILGARGEALEVRVLGATMLRAKARSDGFAMTPSDAAAMTAEVLALLGGPDGATALGPHLASLAAAVSAAGGAHTLADLVARAVAHAAPDAAGGWPADGTLAVGPHAHAAVALLAAVAEESLHRPRAHDRDVVAAMQDALEDVLWVLDAVLSAPSPTVVSHAARAAAFACLDAWIPAGVTLSELRNERPGALAALVHAATRDGDPTAANALAALITAVDPLPGRSEAIACVLDAAAASVDALAAFPPERVFRDDDEDAGAGAGAGASAGAGAGAGAGIDPEPESESGPSEPFSFVAARRVARAVVAVVSACACSEPRATASSRGAASFVRCLLAAARLGGARTAAEAFAPWRRAAGGFVAAFDEPTRGAVAAAAAEAALARLAALDDGRRDAEREAAEAETAGEADGRGESADAYGYGESVDAFADGDLALVADAEATLAAAHASLGSERFFDLVLRRVAIGVESGSESERERDANSARAAIATCGYPLSADADVPPAARRAARFILGDDDDPRRHPHRRPSARALAWSARALRGALRDFLGDAAALEEAARRIVFPGIVGGGDGVVGDRLDRRVLADAACDALGAIFASEAPAGSSPVVDAALERWARLDASEDPIGAESRDVEVVRASERRRAATTRAACAYATSTSARDPHRARNAVDALANAYCDRLAKAAAAAASSAAANAAISPSFSSACASLAAWCSSGAPTLASDATLVAVWSATEAAASLATSSVCPSRRERLVVASCCASWRGVASSLTWPGREAHAIRALQATSARLVSSPGAVACATALLDVAAATIRVCGEWASDDAAALAAKIVRDVSVGVDAMLQPRAGSNPAAVTGPGNEREHHPAPLEPETFVALFDAAAALVAADVSSDPWDATLLAHVSRCVSSEHFDVSNAALQLQTAAWSSRRVGDALSRIAERHAANDANDPGASMEPMDAALEAWAAQLAAQAATRDARRMMEPTANAMWAAGRAARERGAGRWLARAYARGAAAAQTVAGAIAEADVLAFADAAATRDPPHAPRRLEELLVAFGRACRGVGPASEIADFK